MSLITVIVLSFLALACESEAVSSEWNLFEDPSNAQAFKSAREGFRAFSGFGSNDSLVAKNISNSSSVLLDTPSVENSQLSMFTGTTQKPNIGQGSTNQFNGWFVTTGYAFTLGRDIAALAQKLEKVQASCSSGYLALTTRVQSLEESMKNQLANTTTQFNQALSDRVHSLEQSIKNELTNTTTQSNLALSARVQSLEQSIKNEFTTATAQFSNDIQNLRLMLVSRLTPLAFGVDIAAHASMKCSLKKRDRPLPVETMKIDDYLYAEEQFCSTDNATCLYLQSNGNLVLYQTSTLQVIWTTNSGGGDCRSFVKMQGDGRVGLYHYPYGVAEWVTPVFRGAELTFQKNGHLCLKMQSKIAEGQDGNCLWTTDLIAAPV